MTAVTVQINLAPSDFRLAGVMLAHQLRQCGRHAEEVMLTLDLGTGSKSGLTPRQWEAQKDAMLGLIADAKMDHPNLTVAEVDYSPETAAKLSNDLFGGRRLPFRDYRNKPFYAYYFGLGSASNNHILHLDSDILCGGGSPTWLDEAAELLDGNPGVFSCSPFPGPPTADLQLLTQRGTRADSVEAGYQFPHFSSRVFFVDRRRLGLLPGQRDSLPQRRRGIVSAAVHRYPIVGEAEVIISRQMQAAGLQRLDFLGRPPGLWSLHPSYRSERFYSMLPEIVRMVEENDLPAGQRGDYELNSSVIDWSDAMALARSARWRR